MYNSIVIFIALPLQLNIIDPLGNYRAYLKET